MLKSALLCIQNGCTTNREQISQVAKTSTNDRLPTSKRPLPSVKQKLPQLKITQKMYQF